MMSTGIERKAGRKEPNGMAVSTWNTAYERYERYIHDEIELEDCATDSSWAQARFRN
jgi:hypothetical protein